jgi:hypothetical protein
MDECFAVENESVTCYFEGSGLGRETSKIALDPAIPTYAGGHGIHPMALVHYPALKDQKVIEAMRANGLRQGDNGLEIYAMCEIPSNVLMAKQSGGAEAHRGGDSRRQARGQADRYLRPGAVKLRSELPESHPRWTGWRLACSTDSSYPRSTRALISEYAASIRCLRAVAFATIPGLSFT